MATAIPEQGPFALRARILTPLAAGGTRYEADGRLVVDARGVITHVGPWAGHRSERAGGGAGEAAAAAGDAPAVDLRPLVLLPGLVDLHVHLPQLPNAGLGAGLDVLTWLERYTFPLERAFDEAAAERLAPQAFRALAAAGTTTAVVYGAAYAASLDAAFRAAEAHGIRAVMGKVMMDRDAYDDSVPPSRQLEANLRQSAELCARWHLRGGGRLRYAFTPRFAVSCTAELLRESASLAKEAGAYWQTHLSESRPELEQVAALFPEAIDYLDVYDRAGGLGPATILAHAIHLSPREVARLAESGAAVGHCPASNLFLASGAMPLNRYLAAGIRVALGSDVSGGPELSMFATMRAGAFVQSARRAGQHDETATPLGPLDWLRLGTLGGARALGLDGVTGSLEAGMEADLIAVDPRLVAPVPGEDSDDPAEVMSRLAFRPHPDMVRAAWVRGRRLDGPPGVA
jgi:guanine deaminase